MDAITMRRIEAGELKALQQRREPLRSVFFDSDVLHALRRRMKPKKRTKTRSASTKKSGQGGKQ